jgi:radical SAM superfamily enzyme YgiQ (UPF0313 family)
MNDKIAPVLLINPNLMKPPVTPVAIDFLGSALKQAGHEVRFLDLAFEAEIDSAITGALGHEVLFVGLSIRNTDDSFFATRDFCLAKVKPMIDKIRSFTDAPVVIGGVGYSIFPVAALRYLDADFGIRGDGESAAVRLAHALAMGEDPAGIPGLVWKDGKDCRSNEPLPVDLSTIDLSDRSTVDNARYYREGGMVGFETKRGCDCPCSYCADPLAKGTTRRLRPPEQVARELSTLADIGIQHFHTCDSEFNVPYSHAADVCRAFIRAGLGERIRWYAYMTPKFFDDELASLMERAGCVGINFGADHCNAALLRTLGRTHTADSTAEAARLCRKYGIASMFDLLLGAPGETPDTIREAVTFMKKIEPSCVGASMGVRIYPGTAMARTLAPQLMTGAPSLYALEEGDSDFLRPVYYVSPVLGENPLRMLSDAVGGDERFFVASPERGESDYNYNDNSVLSDAIRSGHRGAFWDILRRLRT